MSTSLCNRLAAAALLLAGCTVSMPAPAGGPSAVPSVSTAVLTGEATFPTELAAGGAVLPTGIGSAIRAEPGAYRVVSLDWHEAPVAGARVALRDAATREPLPGVAATTTDDAGRFRFEGLDAGRNALVEVSFHLADTGKAFRLLALARPGAAAPVSWRSTLVVSDLLASGRTDLAQLDLAAVRDEENTRASVVAALAPEVQQSLFDALLAAPEDATATAALPLPSLLPLPPLSPLPPGTASPAASPSAMPTGLATLLDPMASTVGGAVDHVVDGATDAADQAAGDTADTVASTVEDTADDVLDGATSLLSPTPIPTLPGLF